MPRSGRNRRFLHAPDGHRPHTQPYPEWLTVRMRIGDVGKLADALDGVRHTTPGGLSRWEYHGCLVARQLDGEHIVIRANFAYRDAMLRAFPATFEVPQRFRKHMMMVADLTSGDPEAINDSLTAAWELQRNAD